MGEEKIRASLKVGRLVLSKEKCLAYYAPLLLALGFFLVGFVVLIRLGFKARLDGEYFWVLGGYSLFFLLILVVVFYRHREDFRLYQGETPLSSHEIKEKLTALSDKQGWVITGKGDNYMVLASFYSWRYNFFVKRRGLGEQITVIFYDNQVWFNSLARPEWSNWLYTLKKDHQKNRAHIIKALGLIITPH